MHFTRAISLVGCHAEGEVGDVIVGGVLDAPPGTCQTMYDKLVYFRTHRDQMRNLLLNEPRGRSSMNTNLVLPPCDPSCEAGFLILESTEYAPMSGSNTICTVTVLLETGMVEMREPVTRLRLDTAAGVVGVTARCVSGKCVSVAFDNVPAFVFGLDLPVDVPGLGTVKVDIAWGGMWYAFIDAASCGLKIENKYGGVLVEVGERIKHAVQARYCPVHPENPEIKGVTVLGWSHPVTQQQNCKEAVNTVVVSPGRFDRSPCGTGTCARMAILHARGELAVGEVFKHKSIIGTEFINHIRGTTTIGDYPAILPTVQGRAWITSFKQIILDPSDPFPEGFHVGDQWNGMADLSDEEMKSIQVLRFGGSNLKE